MPGDEDLGNFLLNKPPVTAFSDHSYTRLSGLPWHPVVEPMDVFLRIHGVGVEESVEKVFHTVDNENTLVIHSPSNPPEACNVGSQAFRFSKIFSEDASPKVLCNTAFKGVIDTVAKGDNFLVFNYGTKTAENAITLQGSETCYGLVPTAVEALFKRIQATVCKEIKIKPQAGNCIPVGPHDAACEHELRSTVLKKAATTEDRDDTHTPDLHDVSKESVTMATSPDGDPNDLHYSVWVSCLEVYNELIYDLLDCEAPKRRVALRLCERSNRRVYVKDAKEVCVFTAAEAIELFTTAQENLRRATSHLPEDSSHCIFMLRIISSKDGTWFKASKMNQLTFCNLASSEKVQDVQLGGRGKAISASIIALGRCLEAIRSGDALVPYKESKLTRLLQNYFTGWGRALMMVNINLRADMYDATIHVLTFSALASKVLLSWPLDFLAIPFRPTRCSIELLRQILTGHESEFWISPNLEYTQCDTQEDPMQSGSLVILDDEDEEEEGVGTEAYSAKIQDLVELIQLLQQSLIQEKMDKMQVETDCRKELCSHFSAQMRVMEDYYMDRIDAELDDALSYPDKCLPNKKRLKPCRDPSTVSNVPLKSENKDATIAELNAVISDLNVRLETALDTESEAQEKIASQDAQRVQLESRVADLEAQQDGVTATEKPAFMTDSQAQELIAALQLRICKQQHQNNVNETMLNQQLKDAGDKLRTLNADLKAKDAAISQLNQQIGELQAAALNGVCATNATVKEEINQFQQLLDSVQAKLKQNEAVVEVLSKRRALSEGKKEEETSPQTKQCKVSLREANEKIDQLEREKTSLMDLLEMFQRMLLTATASEPNAKRPRRKCAASGNQCHVVMKRESFGGKDFDGTRGDGGKCSAEDDNVSPEQRCRSLRSRNNSSRTQRETEAQIGHLETELAGLKAALKQTLERDGHSQKLPAILEALELGPMLPEDHTETSCCGYRLRQRP